MALNASVVVAALGMRALYSHERIYQVKSHFSSIIVGIQGWRVHFLQLPVTRRAWGFQDIHTDYFDGRKAAVDMNGVAEDFVRALQSFLA
jgi:hypothetical protein